MHGPIRWPDGKDFAFTIFDDCDYQTAENVRAVYDFITEIGLRTTKTVWTVRGSEKPGEKVTGGATCDDEAYLKWALDLQAHPGSRSLYTTSATTPHRGSGRFAAWRDSANGSVMTLIAWRTTRVATKAFTGATPG